MWLAWCLCFYVCIELTYVRINLSKFTALRERALNELIMENNLIDIEYFVYTILFLRVLVEMCNFVGLYLFQFKS